MNSTSKPGSSNSVPAIPKPRMFSELTPNILKKILKNADKNEKVEFIVQIKSIELFCERYFCIIQDGSGKLLKCYFSKTLSKKIFKEFISPQRYIKIMDYYLHRFATSALKYNSTEKFLDLIGISEIEIINIFNDRIPSKRLLTEKPEIKPDEAVNETSLAKIIFPSISNTVTTVEIASLQAWAKCRFIRGTIKTFPASLLLQNAIFLIFDISGNIICNMYGYIAGLLKDQIKDGFTVAVGGFTVRKVVKKTINIPCSSNYEMIVNATSTIDIFDNNDRCVGTYQNQPPLMLDSVFNFDIPTVKYPLLHTIVQSHYNKKFDFIGVIVDQTNVIKTTSVNVKHVTVQDESARVTVTFWRDAADNFSFPNGVIIVGENFYTIKKHEIRFTAYDFAKVMIASTSPDQLRLQKWYNSVKSNLTQSQS